MLRVLRKAVITTDRAQVHPYIYSEEVTFEKIGSLNNHR